MIVLKFIGVFLLIFLVTFIGCVALGVLVHLIYIYNKYGWEIIWATAIGCGFVSTIYLFATRS